MPARVLPPKEELQKLLERGMTHKEIAEHVSRETGHTVRRSSVSAAIHRMGLAQNAKRYPEEIPWTVEEKHLLSYPARMLRLLGRRRAGITNTPEMDGRLDAWLNTLAENHAVVTYLPDTPDGWYYVDGEPNEKGIPIIEHVEL